MNKKTTIYAEVLEEDALKQFNSAMEQPFAVKGALMPDAHKGYSLPIGAVVATDGVVVPSWVGYDIGCGMCALRLGDIDSSHIMELKDEIFKSIYRVIPVGFNKNKSSTEYSLDGLTSKGREIAVEKEYSKALGSLGGGNHFIEIGHDENGCVWIVIHSGSRGVGHGIATHYMKLASGGVEMLGEEFDANHKDLLKHNLKQYEGYREKYIEQRSSRLRPKEGHHGFDVDSQNGLDYIQDLDWCLDFALANRKEMMSRVVDSIFCALGRDGYEVDLSKLINRNHNHAVEKDGLWMHRKGATHAEEGMLGVIPGNMRDGSFIVVGKGNPNSLYSSSHGAGRVLSRTKAKEKLNVNDFMATMVGIKASISKGTLDESPFAYKDIFEVMRLQEDLVSVIAHIKPLINIKG